MADDSYAKSFMKGEGQVLLRDKTASRGLVAILGFFTLWCGGGAVAAFLDVLPKAGLGTALFLTAMTAFFAFLAMTLTVIRVLVSAREVHVQYGLWGPRVAIERIRSCRVTPYDWKEFGGWGIKRGGDGTWAYVLGARADVVELTWEDESGTTKRSLFSAADPPAVVAAIETARASVKQVRVATEQPAAGEEIERDAEDAPEKRTRA